MEIRSSERTSNYSEVSRSEIQKQWGDYILKNGAPDALVVEITNFCPNNCAHCYANIGIGKNTEEMKSSTFKNWVSVINGQEYKPEQIWLVGGEPTKHNQLKEFAEEAKLTGAETILVTTGESFADKEYCEQIVPLFDAIDVSMRSSSKEVHNALMLGPNDKFISSIPPNLTIEQQIGYVDSKIRGYGVDHFEQTLKGIRNISETIKDIGLNTKIGLNVDVQACTDLYKAISDLHDNGVNITNVFLQIQTFTDKNRYLEDVIPNNWRKPTTDMIKEYYRQSQLLIRDGLVNGHIEIIDPLPQNILNDLKSKNFDISLIYNPASTPAINPAGQLRQDVIREEI